MIAALIHPPGFPTHLPPRMPTSVLPAQNSRASEPTAGFLPHPYLVSGLPGPSAGVRVSSFPPRVQLSLSPEDCLLPASPSLTPPHPASPLAFGVLTAGCLGTCLRSPLSRWLVSPERKEQSPPLCPSPWPGTHGALSAVAGEWSSESRTDHRALLTGEQVRPFEKQNVNS